MFRTESTRSTISLGRPKIYPCHPSSDIDIWRTQARQIHDTNALKDLLVNFFPEPGIVQLILHMCYPSTDARINGHCILSFHPTMNPTDWRYSDPDTIRNVIRSLFDILEQPMSWMYVSQHRVVIRTLRQPFLVKNRENTSLRGFSAQVCCDYILWQNDDIKSVDIQVLDSADFNDYWNHVRPSGWGITYCHNLEPWVPLNALNPQPLLKQNPNQKFVMYSFCREFCISNEFLFVPFARHCIKEVHQYAELQANKAKRKMCNLSTDEDAKKQIKVS